MPELTKYERETTVIFNDDSPTATVYTCNHRLMRTLEGKGYTVITKTEDSVTFECPKRCISFRSVTVKPRKMSQSQLDALEKARTKQCQLEF